MRLSVVVATRNRASVISGLLARLSAIDHPSAWELIVVDNGSSDDTSDAVSAFIGLLPLKLLHVPERGKSRALNAALELVRGELILFADDDIEVSPHWLSAWAEVSTLYPAYQVFGGRVRVHASAVPEWILTSSNLHEMLVSLHDLGDEAKPYEFNRYPIGPNMAIRRMALRNTGALWPDDIGPGMAVPLGDERSFLIQISKPDARDRLYLPEPYVMHCPERERLSYAQCWWRCFLGGYAAGKIDCRNGFPPQSSLKTQHIWHRLRTCRSMPEFIAMICRATGVFVGKMGL